MGSQCSCFNKGVTWSCLRPHKISRAAQFWANCSLWTKCFRRPYNRELQLSNLHVRKACTNDLLLSTDKNFLIREIFRMWKNAYLQLQKQILAACSLENRTISSSYVDESHVKLVKIGVWPGTGFEWQMVRTFSVQIFRLGILDYLSRRSVYFGKFPFGQTKTDLPFTSQPKFPEFFGKW